MGTCFSGGGAPAGVAEFGDAHGLRYPGWQVDCTLCCRPVARAQWVEHAKSSAHLDAAAKRGVNVKGVNEAILRQPPPRAARCARCETPFGCCSTPSHCELCGDPCCGPCVSQQRKILCKPLRAVRACIRCQHPLPVARLLSFTPSLHPPAPGTSLCSCPPIELWQHCCSFLDYKSLNNTLLVSRAFLKTLRLPFQSIEHWNEAFGRGQRIGSGSYGDVYRCHCNLTGVRREVAVKVMRKSSVIGLRRWRYIIREIDIQSQIMHTNSIQLLGLGALHCKSHVYVIMELAGQDLFDRITTTGPMSEREAARLTRQLCCFIHDLHRAGVVHRDIKPENLLLVGEPPTLKVCDFGFARFVEPDLYRYAPESNGLSSCPPSQANSASPSPAPGGGEGRGGKLQTQTQALSVHGGRVCGLSPDMHASQAPQRKDGLHGLTPCGTFGFAPPEMIQAMQQRQSKAWMQDAAVLGVDIFGAGVVLHVMLTAHDPFPVQDAGRHLQAVQRGLRLSHPIYAGLSKGATALMQRMLSYDPKHRPSAQAVLNDPWFQQELAVPSPHSSFASRPAGGRRNNSLRKETRAPRALAERGRHQGGSYDIEEDGRIAVAESVREAATSMRAAELVTPSHGLPEFLAVPDVQMSVPRSGILNDRALSNLGSLGALDALPQLDGIPSLDALAAMDRRTSKRHQVHCGSEQGSHAGRPIDFLPSPSGLMSGRSSTDGEDRSLPLFDMD
eukprot:Hpha_TRINITY_DN15833_c2_g2::TRINITY_DN15833_c2_g2_i1::g.187327::m.187327